MPQYHSEPITRKIVGDWHKAEAKQHARRSENPNAEQEWADTWERWTSDDAPKEELIGYFSIATSTLTLIGFVINALATCVLIGLANLGFDVFNLWNTTPFMFGLIFFGLSFGNWLEARKIKKVESYMGYFDGAKFALFSVLGMLVFALAILGLSYLGDTPFWLES